jgi:hypothetical protein
VHANAGRSRDSTIGLALAWGRVAGESTWHRQTSVAILPVVVALGACSGGGGGGSSQNNQSAPDGGSGGAADSGTPSSDGGGGAEAAPEAAPGPQPTEYDAKLVSTQVVGGSTSQATGSVKFLVSPDGQTVTYDITQTVTNAQSVNLHIGPPGETATVERQLPNVSGHMTGTFTPNQAEMTVFNTDGVYIDVTSSSFPAGEIRGQLTAPGATVFVTTPTGAQQVPAVQTQNTAHASFILNADQSTVVYHVDTTATPTNVLIERGIGGVNGSIAYPLTPASTKMDGMFNLGQGDAQQMQAGHFYVQIQTQANPAGELRGQVIPPGATLFTGVLAGINEVPPVTSAATGGTQVWISADQQTLNYDAVVTGIIPTVIELDQGALGMTGSMLHQFALDTTGASGQTAATPADVTAITGGGAYVNVRTASYASGELRAQLVQH